MSSSPVEAVYRFVAFLWGVAMLIVGIPASLGLLAFPWSAEPALAIAIGLGGVGAQMLGAALALWAVELLPTASRAPARVLPGEGA